ncbi:hypothetical protein ACWC9T_06585 [Kitasatospora sp. NPDC001159]
MTVSSAIASFAVVAGMLTIMPGLDTALVLRSAITLGRRRAFATALGILWWLNRGSVQRVIDAITGTVLVGFGVKLALGDN